MPKVTFANTAPMVLKESNIGEMHTPSDCEYFRESMLRVDPKEFINFNSKNAEATLNLKSVSGSPLTYKIQTTSPEKFGVRPRCGVILPNQETAIRIWLKPEHQLSPELKDKFLVMAMRAPACDGVDVSELWKTKAQTGEDVEQHRLVCRFDDKTGGKAECTGKSSKADVDCKKSKTMDPAEAMARQLAFTQNLQYVTLFMLLLLFAGFGFLMYEQLGQHGHSFASSGKSSAYSCSKGK